MFTSSRGHYMPRHKPPDSAAYNFHFNLNYVVTSPFVLLDRNVMVAGAACAVVDVVLSEPASPPAYGEPPSLALTAGPIGAIRPPGMPADESATRFPKRAPDG